MKEKKKYIKKLKKPFKKRLIGILFLLFKNEKYIKFYLSGSHNSLTHKQPTKNSDIDIYIFKKTNKKTSIYCSNNIAKKLKMMLGTNFHIFIVNKEFEQYVSLGMEKLIK